MIVLIVTSFTGCYTSFVPRDYEEESFGQMDEYNYYDSSDVAFNEDSLEYYYPEDEFYYDEPGQEVTVINNFGPDWGWGYSSPYHSRIYTSYGCYDPFYDPYYDPYCYPYYRPYYAYGYGSFYTGYGYGHNYNNYPSSVRYRTNRSHWTNTRNNGGRNVVTRTRGDNREITKLNDVDRAPTNRGESRTIKGFDLDRDLRVSKTASGGSSRSANKSGIRTAGYTRDSNSRSKAKRTSDLERRRVTKSNNNNEIVLNSKGSNEKRTQRVSKKTRVVRDNKSTSKRSKRVYSSKRTPKVSSSNKTSSRSYYKAPKKSSSSSSVSRSSRSNNSNSSSYSSSSSNSSRSSSSRSSVSRSSGSSSSKTSASRSSSRSSDSSSRSTSGSSSRRR